MEKDIVLEKLISISKELYKYFFILNILDSNGYKNSERYQNTINKINCLLNEEDNIYATLNEIDVIDKLLLKLAAKEMINNFKIDLKVLFSKEDILIRRIIIRLLDIKQELRYQELMNMGKDLKEDMDNYQIKHPNSYNKLGFLLKFSNTIKNDFLNSILLLSNNGSKINLLYDLIYLYSFKYRELINNNFTIKSDMYWHHILFKDIYKISDEECIECRRLYSNEIIEYFKDYNMNEELSIILRVAKLFDIDNKYKSSDIELVRIVSLGKDLI